MATFREMLAEHRADVFLDSTHFGETISYTPSGGAAGDVTAVVQRNGLEWMEQSDGSAEVETVSVHVSAADVTQPTRKDSFTTTEPDTSTATWGVDGWTYQDGMWTLRCVKINEAEISGSGYRTRRH